MFYAFFQTVTKSVPANMPLQMRISALHVLPYFHGALGCGENRKRHQQKIIKMKRSFTGGLFVVALVLLSPAIKADQIVLSVGPYQYDIAGEFTASTTPTLPVTGYSSYTATASTFQTFCVQTEVDFSPGSSYSYTMGLSAIGSGQAYLPGFNGSLTTGTAWLYAQFASGGLGSSYDYANASGSRRADAGLLQAAIWALMGEAVPNDGAYTTATTANNIYYKMALDNFGDNLAAATAAVTSSDNDGVEVLQLGIAPDVAQNQLYYNPGAVPDNGTTLVLLGLGVCGLALVGWKFNHSAK